MSAVATDASTVDVEHDGVKRSMAGVYRKELSTRRANNGTGAALDDSQLVTRIARLRRRNATLSDQFRSADKKALDQLEKGLPAHVTAEAD